MKKKEKESLIINYYESQKPFEAFFTLGPPLEVIVCKNMGRKILV